MVSLPHAEHLERLGTFAAELSNHRTMLDKVAKGDKTSAEQWLQDAQGPHVSLSPRRFAVCFFGMEGIWNMILFSFLKINSGWGISEDATVVFV